MVLVEGVAQNVKIESNEHRASQKYTENAKIGKIVMRSYRASSWGEQELRKASGLARKMNGNDSTIEITKEILQLR